MLMDLWLRNQFEFWIGGWLKKGTQLLHRYWWNGLIHFHKTQHGRLRVIFTNDIHFSILEDKDLVWGGRYLLWNIFLNC